MPNVKLTNDVFIYRSNLIHNHKYDYSKVLYNGIHDYVLIICPLHGDFRKIAKDHLRGIGCPKCKFNEISSPKCLNNFIDDAIAVHGYKYGYTNSNYINARTKLKISCSKHGVFFQTPASHLRGSGCPQCAIEESIINNSKNVKDFVQDACIIHGDKYDYSNSEYNGCFEKITIKCRKHGEFKQLPSNHLQGCGCPKCGVSISKAHTIVFDFISNYHEAINNDRTVLNGLEIDVYVPDLKFGVEINGVYYHSENYKSNNYHYLKSLTAQNNGIKLLQFWDYEIYNKWNIVSSIIKHNLHGSSIVHTRKCRLLSVRSRELKKFFDDNHLQGYRDASVNYTLKYNDEIVYAASFSKHQKYEWEIIRTCTKAEYFVPNAFSRILKRFINDHNPNSIMTFADRRYSTGLVYNKANFKLLRDTKPNYFYWRNNDIKSRYSCQKHKLSRILRYYDDNLSERDNMILNGYNKINDAGNVMLLWSK